MSAQFHDLHPYVSQRLLSLFETLAKKHARLESRIHEQALSGVVNTTVEISQNSASADLVMIEIQ